MNEPKLSIKEIKFFNGPLIGQKAPDPGVDTILCKSPRITMRGIYRRALFDRSVFVFMPDCSQREDGEMNRITLVPIRK